MKLKSFLAIMVVILTITGCKSPQYFIGMSESVFIKKNRVEQVRSTADESVYKKISYPFGGTPQVKFFYFDRGELVRVDGGVRSPDIIIERNYRN